MFTFRAVENSLRFIVVEREPVSKFDQHKIRQQYQQCYTIGSGVRTYFVYDGTEPVAELDGSNNEVALNTFGPDGLLSRYTVLSGASIDYQFDPSDG